MIVTLWEITADIVPTFYIEGSRDEALEAAERILGRDKYAEIVLRRISFETPQIRKGHKQHWRFSPYRETSWERTL